MSLSTHCLANIKAKLLISLQIHAPHDMPYIEQLHLLQSTVSSSSRHHNHNMLRSSARDIIVHWPHFYYRAGLVYKGEARLAFCARVVVASCLVTFGFLKLFKNRNASSHTSIYMYSIHSTFATYIFFVHCVVEM